MHGRTTAHVSAQLRLRGRITCGWSVAFCSRHCADAMGAPTLLLICGAKLKVTVDGDLALWLGPPVMVALAGVLLMYTSMSLHRVHKHAFQGLQTEPEEEFAAFELRVRTFWGLTGRLCGPPSW